MSRQKYYRSIYAFPNIPCKCGILTPHETDVEKVECEEGKEGKVCWVKYWSPIVNEPPIFFRSTEKVLCFSKTPGGAVIGSVTSEEGFIGGERCICETTDEPTIDISDELVGDFSVLEEVRFHKPVETKFVGRFTVDKGLLKEIEEAYGWEEFPDTARLTRIRDGISKQVREEHIASYLLHHHPPFISIPHIRAKLKGTGKRVV